MRRTLILTLACLTIIIIPWFAAFRLTAYAQDFRDVPLEHAAYNAITDLRQKNILSGYADGVFKPEKPLARSEAVKMIMAPLFENMPVHGSSPYNDVPKNAWYLPYIEEARKAGIIDGPPAKTAFQGGRTVLTAEFIKMLIRAYAVDTSSLQPLPDILASDVTKANEWYFPYISFGIASSMFAQSAGDALNPGKELTRADAAIFLHAFLEYRDGKRTQRLLSDAEREMAVVLRAFEQKDSRTALLAASHALLHAKGAKYASPEPLTESVVLLAEAFYGLAKGNMAGSAGNFMETESLASGAWKKADEAAKLSASLEQIVKQIKFIAHGMAERARGR